MMRTFQFRLRPNATQRAMLERILVDNAETYNACLQERIEAWKLQRKSITYRDQQDELTELRKDERFQWLACDIQRDPLRRVDRAFKAFFRRVKAKSCLLYTSRTRPILGIFRNICGLREGSESGRYGEGLSLSLIHI